MKLDIELNDRQLDALSQVLKRIGFEDIRRLSETDAEAYNCQYALEQIRKELREKGYSPR